MGEARDRAGERPGRRPESGRGGAGEGVGGAPSKGCGGAEDREMAVGVRGPGADGLLGEPVLVNTR